MVSSDIHDDSEWSRYDYKISIEQKLNILLEHIDTTELKQKDLIKHRVHGIIALINERKTVSSDTQDKDNNKNQVIDQDKDKIKEIE